MKMSRENSSPTDKVCATDPKLNSSGVLRDPVTGREEIGNCLNIFGISHR